MTTTNVGIGQQAVATNGKSREGRLSDQSKNNAKATSSQSDFNTPASLGNGYRKTTHAASTPTSLHTSPQLAGNAFMTQGQSGFDSWSGEQQQMALGYQFSSSNPSMIGYTSNPNAVNGNGTSLSNSTSTNGSNNRMRASTSTLPASHAALLNSMSPSAQMAAAAQAAANAAVLSSSSLHYRTNGMQGSLNPSSSSTPSSSSQAAMQNNYYFHYQLQQQLTYEKHTVELTNCIISFLSPILPTEEEYRIKEATRRQLERLAGRVSPGAKLLAFGSMANGFALRHSASDGPNKATAPSASELVEVLGKLIREETDYTVLPLPKARIPIIKLTRAPTAESPYEIACDIGFENRLALENTRLLLSYAMVDPPRLRTLVLFLKVWTKRRKLNSPYTGTLSSYGYTLMMIFFLTQVKRPAVLPNLQRIPPSSPSSQMKDVTLNGHNIYFYDDVATLRKEWTSFNTENVGELLIEFFRYFSKEFPYSKDVISIRTEGGLKPKDGQIWSSELCIEDPFQTGYNVARTVTRDGLYTIRGEFMRASRILTSRGDRVVQSLAELCEEREDGLTRAPDTPYNQRHRASFASSGTYNSGIGAPDSRYLRETARRYDLSAPSISGFGGSFAFEEMARGLGQAQKSSNTMAYPPTTAMLAPLSQNTGLSPRNQLMRAGLRYDTPRRGQSGSPMNSIPSTSKSLVGSSTRSEDGGNNYEKKMSKKGSVSSNVSARTSPNLDNSVPHGFLHPNSALEGGGGAFGGAGLGLACGSEISFGSQRFQLHPQSISSSSSTSSRKSGNAKEDFQQNRSSRSFSDGINRSMSLPRSHIDPNEVRRSSTPLLSEPVSPSNLLVGVGLPVQGVHSYLEPSMASLAIHNGHYSSSPRSSISDQSGGGKEVGIRFSSSQSHHHPAYRTAINGNVQQSQQSVSSPRLPPSPWSFDGQHNPSRDSQVNLTPEEEGSSFALDDDPITLSDDALEESARMSTTESSKGQHRGGTRERHAGFSSHGKVKGKDGLEDGKVNAIRSWAATQSAAIRTQNDEDATLKGKSISDV